MHRVDFDILELCEKAPFVRGQPAAVLHAEPHEQRHPTVRHVDDLPYRGTCPVEHGDECKLFREITAHRIGNAVVQVLRECGRRAGCSLVWQARGVSGSDGSDRSRPQMGG